MDTISDNTSGIKPTQAQIEAAAESLYGPSWRDFKDCYEAAEAALTAAAEVGEQLITPPIIKERCSRCHVVLGDMDKAMADSNRLWRALNGMNEDDFDKRARNIIHQTLDGMTIGPSNRATVQSTLAEHFADIEAATIERCAQEMDRRAKLWKSILTTDDEGEAYAEAMAEECESAAAAIRALKEKP